MTPTERYVSLAVGIIAIILFLWRIAWTTGRLYQEFRDHQKDSEKIHKDIGDRVWHLEHPSIGRRRTL